MATILPPPFWASSPAFRTHSRRGVEGVEFRHRAYARSSRRRMYLRPAAWVSFSYRKRRISSSSLLSCCGQ